jgi:hypothetical protein
MRPVAAALLLAGCAATPGARVAPSEVILYRQTLTVSMSDRSLCVGLRERQGPAWQGTLQGCPHLWRYQASLPPGPFTRQPLVQNGAGPGTAEIAAPDGRRWRYGTPARPAS